MDNRIIIEKVELTLEGRFQWLFDNQPAGWRGNNEFVTWEDTARQIKEDMYRFTFNHPGYIGPVDRTSDEVRHMNLDDLNVPRIL